MKKLLMILAIGLSNTATAADRRVSLTHARGDQIALDVYNGGMSRVVLLAAGAGCNPRADLYDNLAAEAGKAGFTLVRLVWAYCLANPADGKSSQDLLAEKEDLEVALDYVRNVAGYTDEDIIIGGKSLGSYIAFEVFKEQKKLSRLVLLTPVCTDATDAHHPKNVFAENYSGLVDELRPVFLIQGNRDPLCHSQHFQEFVSARSSHFVSLSVPGDHGLGLKLADGTYDANWGLQNIRALASWLFSWIK